MWILNGDACTKIVWPSFGQVLLPIHKTRILLKSTCEALSGKPFNPCGATVLKLSSCWQGFSTYVDSMNKQQDASLLGLYQLSYIYLQAIAAVLLFFFGSV